MYTGLIRALSRILKIIEAPQSRCFHIQTPPDWQALRVGESIAMNGVCLTITTINNGFFTVEAVAETLRKTTLGQLTAASMINLERCLKQGDRIEGHWLTGHIDGCGEIVEIKLEGDAWLLKIRLPNANVYLIDKGCIGMDGMSITVIKAYEDYFTVTLIPHTQRVTVAQFYQVGTQVNLEFDAALKYLQQQNRLPIAWQSKAILPTQAGDFICHTFSDRNEQQVTLVLEKPTQNRSPLVRIHSACMTSEVLGSLRCDCKAQLDQAKQRIAAEGGYLIYLPQEGRGIGLLNKMKAYALQDTGLNTVDANTELGFSADERCYRSAVEVLKHFNLSAIRLLTNNPHKVKQLEALGIRVQAREPLIITPQVHNQRYLKDKTTLLGHQL